jgi:DtxR family Mn-dependent transcriptional regulator
LNTPLFNLTLFVAVVVVAVLLFAPRFGLFFALRRRKREAARIRLEDALKHIFAQEDHDATATLASLTDALRVASSHTLALTERMQTAGLVSVVDNRFMLTDDGRRYALQVIRAHRLYERYLADETGVDPVKWHALAEQREHSLSPEETDALADRLGHPRFDPHGDPIPTADGELPHEKVSALTGLKAGEDARVVHIEDEPEAVYAQLIALGVYPGMELHIDARTDERIIIEAEGRRFVMAPIVAGNVSIERITAGEKEAVEAAHETLLALGKGEAAQVARISPACRGLERRRLMDLGILPGTRMEYERRGLTGGLTAFRVRDTVIALREEQADMITIQQREKVTA